MHKSIVVALASLFAVNVAFAQATPATPATPAKPAAPAAAAAEKKAERAAAREERREDRAAARAERREERADARAQRQADCEARAVSKKEGKPLHGAARNAFMKKCMGEGPAKK